MIVVTGNTSFSRPGVSATRKTELPIEFTATAPEMSDLTLDLLADLLLERVLKASADNQVEVTQ